MLITISNSRSKRVNNNTPGKNVYMHIFMFVDFAVIEIQLFNRKKKNMATLLKLKLLHLFYEYYIYFTSITPILRTFLDLFSDIISFQHVSHFGVGINQIERKLKVKTEVFP